MASREYHVDRLRKCVNLFLFRLKEEPPVGMRVKSKGIIYSYVHRKDLRGYLKHYFFSIIFSVGFKLRTPLTVHVYFNEAWNLFLEHKEVPKASTYNGETYFQFITNVEEKLDLKLEIETKPEIHYERYLIYLWNLLIIFQHTRILSQL
jgi:hypothetical protein